MSNTTIILSTIIGLLGFLFLLWRRLKEDYTSEQIFSFGFIVALFLEIGFFIGLFFQNRIHSSSVFSANGLWFWLAFIFMIMGFAVAYLKPNSNAIFKLRFFELLEATGIGFIFWFFSNLLINSIKIINLPSLIYSVFIAILISFFFFLDNRYKSFSWYKSGKVGFTGLVILGIFFLSRSVVALLDPGMLSFIGKVDAIISAIASFGFFITLYNLGEI
ncbi:hypothetical protein BH10PAT1_BH10PAT1_7000 [soil metagenome]